MQKMINTLWQVFLTIWHTQNGELYGKDYEEQHAIALAMTWDEVSRIYEEAKHYVNDAESAMLHSQPLEATDSQVDQVASRCILGDSRGNLEQNVDPGWIQ
jgi:hypothetical protein